jgi:CubicO group peptidase (beta-lactamase class C family)
MKTQRRWWRRAGVAGLVVLTIAVAGFLRFSTPCWPSYRAPERARSACLAALAGSRALNAGFPRIGLAALEWAWARGERSAWIAPSAAEDGLRRGPGADVEPWLERTKAAHVSAEELDADLQTEGLAQAPRYLAWRSKQTVEHPIGAGLGHASLESAGFRAEALEALLQRAKETHSSALVLVKDGALVGEWYFGGATQRTDTMSATKPIAGLAIGFLVADGTIPSVDTPLSTYFPQWREGLKAKVTLRHVLQHTSGLEAKRRVTDFIWRDDFVEAALSSPIITEPGTTEFYNNKAVNLLSGVVKATTGKPLDALLDERLFTPLGVDAWNWIHDPRGNPHAMSGLQLHPLDLAKVGVMLADGGVWQGRRILPAEWIAAATSPGVGAASTWGYLFIPHFRTSVRTLTQGDLSRWREASVDAQVIAKLATLVGQSMDSSEWIARAKALLGPGDALWSLKNRGLLPEPVRSTETVGYSAIGSYGIHLTVYPAQRLVAVRMAQGMSDEEEVPDFPGLVRRLFEVPEGASPQ